MLPKSCQYLIYFVLLWIFFSAFAVKAQPLPPFSAMDVFELEWVENPQISPDGSKVVYVRRGMDIMKDRRQSRIWIINSDGTDHQKLTNNDQNESSPRWSPDGSKIAFTSSTENGSEVFVYWLNSAKVARLSSLHASPRGIRWSPDGQHLAFSMFVSGHELSLVKAPAKPKGAEWAPPPRITTRVKHEADGSGYMRPGFYQLFTLPASGGSVRQITSGPYNHRSAPVWTKDAQHLVFSANRSDNWEYEFRNSEIYKVNIKSGLISQLTDRDGPDHSPAISPDGVIAYIGYDDKKQTYQLTKLYTMDINGLVKSEKKLDLDRSVSSPMWSKDGEKLYVQYDDKGNTKIAYVSSNGSLHKVADNLGGTGIGRPYGGGSYSVADDGSVVYTHTTPSHPSELAIKTDYSKAESLIMSLNDDLLAYRSLSKVEEIWYKSSMDDRDIQGWIAYPPDYDSNKKYPLIVENHGGPIANYGDRFSPEIQLYASAGYIVFYPNPRGSTSYGEDFGNLLYHNYPGDDYQDVMDGVDAVLRKGITSEDQLFVTGGSAGGIMTAWMIGKNNRFKASAVVKPVMNWISKTLTADNYYGYANTRYPGQPWENPQVYWDFSPISLVGNIQTPTLVMVGTSDMRTPLSEAKQLYHALKLRKIDTALVEIPGAYHFISNRPSQLITKIEHVVAWFDRYR